MIRLRSVSFIVAVLAALTTAPLLAQEASGSASSGGHGYDVQTLSQWQASNTSEFGERLAILWQEMPNYGDRLAENFARVTSPEAGWDALDVVLWIGLSLAIALAIERVTTLRLLNSLYRHVEKQERTMVLKFKFISIRVMIQLLGLAVMGLVGYLLGLFFVDNNAYTELLYIELLRALVQFRMWLILIRAIFSPNQQGLRPIPMEDAPAARLFFWFTIFFFIVEFGDALYIYLENAGLGAVLLTGLLFPYTLAMNLILLGQVWVNRHKITAMFSENGTVATGGGFNFVAQSWPFFFTAWVVLLWMLWLYYACQGQWELAVEVGKSWWITLAFPVADRMFHGLIRQVEGIDWLQSPHYEARAKRFVNVVQTGFRFVLFGLAIYLLSNAWGLESNMLMQESAFAAVTRKLLNIVIFGVVAYVIWELVHALIERKLPVEEVDAIASLEGDGGGAGATRAETLVPLMRTVLTVVLGIFFLLTVLHSLGIAIGPLLAGAGVVGIAIGFGAQKLVQDVISGIFFLIDDAFRKGEYIELEGLKGTVEKISLRSMQLRHHLGAVQTVPYGEIRTVKNLSRDWITMKLELRLPYDADIEKVRKIIKKVGQTMLEDPEMGPSFILPLKSQGVMRVEESALIVRMKFTTKPGEQWVIRREAYRNVRDALAEAGIHFAHREVRVRVPELEHQEEQGPAEPTGEATGEAAGTADGAAGEGDNETVKEKIARAAAAAATGVIASEALKQGRLDAEDYDDEM